MQDRPLDPSLKLLLDALELAPDNAPLRMHVASALEKHGQYASALAHYDRLANDGTHGIEALLGAARSALGARDNDGAWDRIGRLLARVPDHAMGLLVRARVREKRREHREARNDYERAVALDPSLTDANLWDAIVPASTMAAEGEAPAGSARGSGEVVTFGDVGGLDELKERVRMKIIHPFKNPELFKTFKKRTGGGILLYGPPGCGKTFLARAIAGECGAHFNAIGLHEVLDMWIGNSEQRLHAVFEEARRKSPSVLFFDEVDALGLQRAKLASGAMRGVITQFLAELDGFQGRNEKVLVIGATNTPWDLDPAFRRPGRFDQVLFVPPPDTVARAQVLRLKLHERPQGTLDIDRLAGMTELWSGADLEHLVETAAEIALSKSLAKGSVEPISMAMLDAARSRLRPTTREWFTTARNYAQYANEAGQYDDIVEYMRRHKLGG
jgi:SpoVK/Ycf46/Vps4 family AAA+-type ATPase